jgi:hypothetical protein
MSMMTRAVLAGSMATGALIVMRWRRGWIGGEAIGGGGVGEVVAAVGERSQKLPFGLPITLVILPKLVVVAFLVELIHRF